MKPFLSDRDTPYRLHENVIEIFTPERSVIFLDGQEYYLELDELSKEIWSLLVSGSSFNQIMNTLVHMYEVKEDLLRADVDRVIKVLKRHGFIR